MRKVLLTVGAIVCGLFVGSTFAYAQKYQFVPLAPIPGITDGAPQGLVSYLNVLFFLLITIAGIIAVAKIAWAGILYMTSEAFGTKGKAKDDIRSALIGLIIIIATYVILVTINPCLVNFNIFTGNDECGSNLGNNARTTMQQNIRNNGGVTTTPPAGFSGTTLTDFCNAYRGRYEEGDDIFMCSIDGIETSRVETARAHCRAVGGVPQGGYGGGINPNRTSMECVRDLIVLKEEAIENFRGNYCDAPAGSNRPSGTFADQTNLLSCTFQFGNMGVFETYQEELVRDCVAITGGNEEDVVFVDEKDLLIICELPFEN